jgi:PEP-CTERM motif
LSLSRATEKSNLKKKKMNCMRSLTFVLLGLAALAAPVRATLINFDDGIATNPIGSFYSTLGVTFSNASWQTNFGLAGFSGPLGAGTIGADPYRSSSAAPIVATFATPKNSASVVILDLGDNGFTLNAYDATTGGSLVSSMTLFGIGLGNNNFQTLSVSAASILRLEMFQAQSISADGAIVEDLQFASSTSAPEPGTWALLALGLCGGALIRRRQGESDAFGARAKILGLGQQ